MACLALLEGLESVVSALVERQTYVRARILDVLHQMMFFHLGNQMSAWHPLMKFPLHRDGMAQSMVAIAHSYHAADEEDTPMGSESDSYDPSTHHSWHELAVLVQGQQRAKLVLDDDV
jgi:hypothetical protein